MKKGQGNMADDSRNERDLILAPNEFAMVNDATKGSIDTYVGPFKTSLAATDKCVVFDQKSKRFKPVPMSEGAQILYTAPEGYYIILKNVAEGGKAPSGSGKLSTPNLNVGKKVNISGPASFALWPGQMAKVVQGHSLKSNEYLICRVYDEAGAKENWDKAVIKTQDVTPTTDGGDASQSRKSGAKQIASTDIPSAAALTMGKLFVVRGTEVSFYIPPTGIEVVTEKVNGEERFVREAVSLERLEYCLLLDQNGNKRYVRGPDVVFPKPTEKFVDAAIKSNPDKARAKKFRAQELTVNSGIHIRVISDYVEADGTARKSGDELFITGATDPVYFPREEHAIIKYGEQDVHFGIAIPAGEARYVLNRLTGEVKIVAGPMIFLADPREEVIAQRALPLKLCELVYPGNNEALEINAHRLGVDDQDFIGAAGANAAFLNSSYQRSSTEDENYGAVAAAATPEATRGRGFMIKGSSKALPGDAFDRKSKFTAPRSVILNTKYDGAVTVKPYTNFAMLLVRGNDRRVVQGPGTFMLEYDEVPQVMTLSTGKPKTTDKLFQTVYLQVRNNVVSDIIEVETKDFCRLNVKLAYRVNFEGDQSQWFNVDNYVKFLCDHMRSRVRNAVQKLGIEEFYHNYTDTLRNVILGSSPGEGKTRPGTTFAENGMRIYDVEILNVAMQNAEVEKMLTSAQREVIQNTLMLAGERRKLDFVKEAEDLKRQAEAAKAETEILRNQLAIEASQRKLSLDLANIDASAKAEAERQAAEKARAEAAIVVDELNRANQIATKEALLAIDAKAQELSLAAQRAAAQNVIDKAAAMSPGLIEALQAFGERAMVEKVAEAMAPMGIITGGKKSVLEFMQDLLKGTDLAKQLGTVVDKPNGASRRGAQA